MEKQKLKVCLWAINDSLELMQDLCAPAIQTAEQFEIETELLGIGKKFRGHKHRIWLAYEVLRSTAPSDMVILMDGGDTLFNDFGGNIIQKFLSFRCKILISAERNFTHQYYEYKDRFDQIDSDYRYVNAGTLMGYAGDLLIMWKELIELESKFPKANDQGLLGIWTYYNLDNQNRVKLDTRCEIFWVLAGEHRRFRSVVSSEGTLFNPSTNTKPAILHITGNRDPFIKENYLTCLDKIIQLSQRQSYRIILISPLVQEDDYFLWAPRKHDYDENRPVWYREEHPNIISFFYGITEQRSPEFIHASHFYEAIFQISQRYYFDCIIHVPKGHIFYHHELLEIIQSGYNQDKLASLQSTDYAISENFIYAMGKFYAFPGLRKVTEQDPNIISDYIEKTKANKDQYILAQYKLNYPEFPSDVISLGGWCGPAVATIDLKIRLEAYPFCMIHSTIDCIMEIIQGNTSVYFEEGIHTLMPHHDMKDPVQKMNMQKRIDKFIQRLRDPKPILFIRTIINPDFQESIDKMLKLEALIRNNFSREDKYILAFHDQHVKTAKIGMLRSNIMLWAVEGKVGWTVPNREEVFQSYRRLIRFGLDEDNWIYDIPHLKNHIIIPHQSEGIHKALFEKSEA